MTHGEGPQLVLAGAGSGKTRVITYRIAWLVQERGVDPAAITAVTFTNKAAGEMNGRVEELLALYPLASFVGTFHRFALRLLRIYGEKVDLPRGFSIFDTSDQQSLAKQAIAAAGLSPKNFTPQAVLAAISGAKNRLLGPSAYDREADDFFARQVAPVYHAYQKLLRKAGGVDFDDMIRLAVKLLRGDPAIRGRVRGRIRHLLVDEFQDTNHAQLALIRELSDGSNLTAVGDEDQSIYRWRGAEIANILDFEESFPGAEVRKLERNYRSTQTILDAAGAVVSHNELRRGKTLWTDVGAGERLGFYRARDEQDEARWVVSTLLAQESEHELAEMAILVRTNAQTRALEEELTRRRMDYVLIGSVRFYERAEVKDLVAYLRLVKNPRDVHSFARVLNRPPRGIGKATEKMLFERAKQRGKTPWDVLVDDDLARFPKRGALALLKFRDLLRRLADESEGLPVPALLERVLEASAYADLYDEEDRDGRTRLENVGELLSATREFTVAHSANSVSPPRSPAGDVEDDDLLAAFLDHAALASAADTTAGGKVSLMTLHAAKGLEFKVVVLPGLEEDLLPHYNATAIDDDVEEERRLLYVGMTRSGERLFLSAAARRRRSGLYQDQRESRFVDEIPAHLVEVEESPELAGRRQSMDNVYAFLGGSAPPQGPSPSDGDQRHRTPSRLDKGLRRGSRVRHAALGVGQVLRIDGEGEAARLVVYFDGVGRRKLLARYAQLELV